MVMIRVDSKASNWEIKGMKGFLVLQASIIGYKKSSKVTSIALSTSPWFITLGPGLIQDKTSLTVSQKRQRSIQTLTPHYGSDRDGMCGALLLSLDVG